MFLQSQRRDSLIHRYVAVESAKPRGYLFSRCPRLFVTPMMPLGGRMIVVAVVFRHAPLGRLNRCPEDGDANQQTSYALGYSPPLPGIHPQRPATLKSPLHVMRRAPLCCDRASECLLEPIVTETAATRQGRAVRIDAEAGLWNVCGRRHVTLREHRTRREREQRQSCDHSFHFLSPSFAVC
jgi:hypothetical protein